MDYLKNKDLKIFFSGIGGVSMSAIAAALKQSGYEICGSDISESETVNALREMGIKIFSGHKSENIENCGLLVYNARIKEDNPEIIRAKELNIPAIPRAKILGELMRIGGVSIGISGTHGKTTVTSMISEIFTQAGKEPSFFIGAPPLDSAYKMGKNDYFIAESDEYQDQFLDLYPNISLILNIEMDHPDFFPDLNAVISSFEKFLGNTSEAAVICAEDKNAAAAVKNFKGEVLTYSLIDPLSGIFVKNIYYPGGFPEFDILADGEIYAHIKLPVPGEYNIYNAAAAASAAYKCRIEGKFVEQGLNKFKGAGRRFEYKGTLNGAAVYDDYAHHPTEIKKTLLEAQKIAKNKNGSLWYVFQPHTYSRTYNLFGGFCEALSFSGHLVLTGIYSAAEKNIYGISSGDIAAKLQNCVLIEDFFEIAKYLKKNAGPNDLIIIAGAGDITDLTKMLV